MEVAVKVCFRNHLYQFQGKVYRQSEGGPIGLCLSMAVSRIVMGMWDKQLAKLGAESGWVIHLLKRYVDDVRGGTAGATILCTICSVIPV